MIDYTDRLDTLTADQLVGFFVGWPNPPDSETHLRLLHNSYRVWLAQDTETGDVVGFVNAVSDGVLAAYIPLLEVRPAYQGRGIGTALMEKMLDSLAHLYMIDLTCDATVQPFYDKLGMRRAHAMILRRYANQGGA